MRSNPPLSRYLLSGRRHHHRDELAGITELAIRKYDSELDDVIAKIAKYIERDTIALARRKLREADSDIEIVDKDAEEFIFMRKELTH